MEKTARPFSPTLRKSPSVRNAARARKPLSSNRMRKNSKIASWGRKHSTPPAPRITPFVKRERSQAGAPHIAEESASASASVPSAIREEQYVPGENLPNVSQNVTSTAAKNAKKQPTG